MLRWIAFGLAGLAAVLATALAAAPARFVDLALERASLGRVRMAEANGTVWSGSGRLVFADIDNAEAADKPPRDAAVQALAGVAIPGRVHWDVRPWPLLAGLIDASLNVDGMSEPVQLQGSFGELRVGPGRLALPSVELSRLGSPWNSIRPSGALGVEWQALTIRDGQLAGDAAVELRDASSALTPVRPLGSYRVEIQGRGSQADLALETLNGPLQLNGKGTWDARAGLRFMANATAEPAAADRLRSFLGVIGRREGERTIIRIGA